MHNLLARQLKKLFGRADGFDPSWQAFLARVDDVYQQQDLDRQMLERALELSSEELLQANSELRAIFRTLPDVYLRVTREGQVLDFKGPEEPDPHFSTVHPIGKYLTELFPPDTLTPSFVAHAMGHKSMQTVEYRIAINGKTHYYEARCVSFGTDQAIIVIRNITHRRQAEDALRKEAREKALILDTMSEIIGYMDRDYNVIWANQTLYRTFNLSPDGQALKKCFHLHGRTTPCPICPVVKAMETGVPQIYPDLSSYGRRWILRGYPVRNEEGNVIGAVEIVTDVTDSRLAEEALRKSEERYKVLVENATVAIIIIQDELIKFLNPKACESTGYRPEELIDMPAWNFFHPDDLPMVRELQRKRLQGKKVPSLSTARIMRKDGRTIWGKFRHRHQLGGAPRYSRVLKRCDPSETAGREAVPSPEV